MKGLRVSKNKMPANFCKISAISKQDSLYFKCVSVKKLNTKTRCVPVCFHPISRMIED